MDQSNEEDHLQWSINVYRSCILEHVQFSHLISYVDCVREKRARINKLDRDGKYQEAGELFLEILEKSDEPGRWKQFQKALTEEGYEHVLKLLEGDIGYENHDAKRKIIELFQKNIEQNIDARELCDAFKGKDILSAVEEEEIFQIAQNHGDIRASIYLLDHIWKKKIGWYEDFLRVLIDLNRTEVARMIDPDFVEKVQATAKMNGVTEEMPSCSGYANEEQTMDITTMEANTLQVSGEAYCSEKNFAASEPALMQTDAEETCCLKAKDDEIESSNINMLSSEEDHQETKLKDKMTGDLNLVPNSDSTAGECASDEENNAEQDDDDDVDVDVDDDDDDDDDDDMSQASNNGAPAKILKLRPYQEELTTLALSGKNTIIVAPTGSGKTIVAAKIMQEHLKKRGVGVRKIIFLVNQVALAKQQHDSCKEYMDPDWPMVLISGETQDTNKVPLKDLLDRNRILFLTAQILVDALREKEIESLTAVSMLVFDECHHTKARHPFNEIMSAYMDLKFGENSEQVRLPQIIGLTASVGVGKANTLDGAVKHIKNLCANLDSEFIVTVKKNEENLAHFSKMTSVDIKTVNRRSDDQFQKHIVTKLMQPIESKLQKYVHENTEMPQKLSSILTPPAQHACEQYSQWISSLRREIAKLDDQKMQRILVSCRIYLEVYNDALILNEDCLTKSALEYIDEKFSELHQNQRGRETETEIQLKEDYEKNKPYLRYLSTIPESDNPKIKCLQTMLMKAFKDEPESRAMVFVKTKNLAVALKNWMKETPGLKELNPGFMTGQSSVEKGGMTKTGQIDVLKYFRQGQHKLIVATSVAEEGLDVSACNLVIRYDHVTNEIAMVQARGRARAENSKFAVIASPDKGSAQKEELNLVRELLMKRAIVKLQSEVEQNGEMLKQEIEKIQKQAKLERGLEALMFRGRQLREDDFALRCFGCNAFACLSSEIKTLEKSHHAVLSEDFDEHVEYKPHPKPVTIGNMKKQSKMFCKKCGFDWGISVIYKNAAFPIVKIQSFILEDSMGNRDNVKKWKNAPFAVNEFNQQDLERKLALLNDSQ